MNIQIGLAIDTTKPVRGGSGQAALAARFLTVNADGWSADYPDPPSLDPDGAPERFAVDRAGFSTTGLPQTHRDLLTVTRRIRNPYPDQATLTASTVALSDYVYQGDVVLGAANASTIQAPKPIANWVLPDRLVVGDTVTLEIVAFHRDARSGEQVACVEFTATDGAVTVTQKIAGSVISPRASDRNPVIVYRATLDLASLANPATITCNARVYPWLGDAAAVLDSAAVTAAREFSPRVYRRDTARAAAPPLAYVSLAGNDTTGTVSTSAATAGAAPFLTVLGAIKALKAATAVTGGRIDGCEVRLGAGQFVATSLASADVIGGIQDHAALTITRDPAVARNQAVLTFGASSFRTRFPYLRLADCTIQRTGTAAFVGETTAPLQLVLDDVELDNNSHNASLLGTASLRIYGCDLRNAGSSPIAAGVNEVRCLRGLLNSSGATVENWLVVGSRLTGGSHASGNFSNGTRSSNGAICAYSYLSGYRVMYGGLAEAMACAIVQNVIEYASATSNTALSVSADGNLSDVIHSVVAHNTVAGFFNNGRSNCYYDETAGTPRQHRLLSVKGNIHVSVNTKGDVFMLDGARRGNWPYLYGVGTAGEFHQFDAASASFRQEFPGLAATLGSSTTIALDPQFTAPAHTVSGPTAGAGGGSYAIAPTSPAKGRLPRAVLRFDLAGQARPGTGCSAGAYE
jgi:hypothetical protein